MVEGRPSDLCDIKWTFEGDFICPKFLILTQKVFQSLEIFKIEFVENEKSKKENRSGSEKKFGKFFEIFEIFDHHF